MKHFLFFVFVLLFTGPALADGKKKTITSAFCTEFTYEQITTGDFQQPLSPPLATLRVTQEYHTSYQQGYCQSGSGQFSGGSKSCKGKKIYYGHDGLDLHPAGSRAGQNDVMSIQSGLVVASHAKGEFSGWGESIIIATRPNKYSEEILTFHYHHLHAVGEGSNYLTTRLFNACENVSEGQVIAKEGGTPSWPTHLHLSIKQWKNLTELKNQITKTPGAFYGYGYTFGNDQKVANFLDPEGLLFDYFREFNQDQAKYPDWQWAKSLTLFMRSKGWYFGLFDGSFGVQGFVKKRDLSRWLKISLELPTSTSPLIDNKGKAIFTDLKPEDFDLPYINTLYQQKQQIKIIDGDQSCVWKDSHYCPDTLVTKADALKMVVAGFYQNQFLSFYNNWVWKSPAPLTQNILGKFQDVSPFAWYAPYVYFAWQNNLIQSEVNFVPDAPIKKADLAKWLVLAYQNKHNSESTFCQKLECPSERYCDEALHQCEIIPSCLPKAGLPCPLGGGYQLPPGAIDPEPVVDAGIAEDAGAPLDAGLPEDAGVPADAGSIVDAGNGSPQNPCQCESGPCCDGCNFLTAQSACSTYYSYNCQGTSLGDDAIRRLSTRNCSGNTSSCEGQLTVGDWSTYQDCNSSQQCLWTGSNAYCQDVAPNCTVKYTASPSGQSCFSNPGTSGAPTICLETKQQTSSNWLWRVCKQNSTFANNYSYLLLDQNHLSHNFGSFTGSSGQSCSAWQNADFSYLTADGPSNGAGLIVQLLSPVGCSAPACTYFSGIVSLYRNCL